MRVQQVELAIAHSKIRRTAEAWSDAVPLHTRIKVVGSFKRLRKRARRRNTLHLSAFGNRDQP